MLSPEEKAAKLQQLAAASFSDLVNESSIQDDIKDIVETNIGGGSVSEKLISELITLVDNHYGLDN
tara:strand:- start:105 stop:302 length:198 start_codon:yes stop_codon:yes gene_type:complete